MIRMSERGGGKRGADNGICARIGRSDAANQMSLKCVDRRVIGECLVSKPPPPFHPASAQSA